MYWRHILLVLILTTLFLLPQIFWGKLYIVGGDDSRLYYLFPEQYLRNFSFKVIGNNTLGGNLGYFPVSYSAPILILIALFKHIFPLINTQLFMYGMIFMIGFLFMYLLLQEIWSNSSIAGFFSSVIAALYFVCSPFILKTFMQHQLISIYIIMAVPGSLYFFIKGLKQSNYKYVLLSSLYYSIFSATLLSAPWFLATLFTLIPFFIFIANQYKKMFLKSVVIFIISVIVLNLYWIVHQMIPMVFSIGEINVVSSILSNATKASNNYLIEALTRLNTPTYQIINTVRTSWMDQEGPTLVQSIGAIYLLVILFAGTKIFQVGKNLYEYYVVSVIGLLFTMIFFTPNFGSWNLWLFQWLNNHIPLFSMFRNTYDKFALGMAFHYAFALYISLLVLDKVKIKLQYKYIGLCLLIVVIIATSYPYLFPKFNDREYSIRISGSFNKDFIQLVDYLKDHPTTSRYVWLPMTYPGYVFIKEEGEGNHYYAGLSPLQFLSQSSDIAGFYGIQTPADPELNSKVRTLLRSKDYDAIGRVFQKQNIGYVIVNKETLPKKALVFLDSYPFMSDQNDEYKNVILGEKIQDFGMRYSLYRINPRYYTDTVFFMSNLGDSLIKDEPVSYTYKKIHSGLYEVVISAMTKPVRLILTEPYSRLWNLQLINIDNKVNLPIKNTIAYDFGNAWEIAPSTLMTQYPKYVVKGKDGSISLKLHIQFLPDLATKPAIIISVASFFCILSLLFLL